MKTLLKLAATFLLLLTLASNGYSQSCSSTVLKYSGPTTTTQLTALLNTSDSTTYPLIYTLPSYVKSSLETYIGFSSAGLPLGMSGSDSNIARLLADTVFCSALFSEIFNQQAFVHNHGGGPAITTITVSQFNAMTSGGIAYSGGCSFCANCSYPSSPGGCCYTCYGCGGCCDQIIAIGGSWYNVQ
jgi:hypothetical protein